MFIVDLCTMKPVDTPLKILVYRSKTALQECGKDLNYDVYDLPFYLEYWAAEKSPNKHVWQYFGINILLYEEYINISWCSRCNSSWTKVKTTLIQFSQNVDKLLIDMIFEVKSQLWYWEFSLGHTVLNVCSKSH